MWLDGVEEMRLPEEEEPRTALVSRTHNCPAYVSPEMLVSVRSGGAIQYDGPGRDPGYDAARSLSVLRPRPRRPHPEDRLCQVLSDALVDSLCLRVCIGHLWTRCSL